MKNEEAEGLVQQVIETRGFKCERFSKAERVRGKTPDFRVSRDGIIQFYLEVKSLLGEDPLDVALFDIEPFQIATILRNDPRFNRVAGAIHKAVKQFDAVNPDRSHPNVLALVNYDNILSDVGDLIAVLTGKFISEDGTEDLIYGKYARGRVSADAQRVDLYLWVDPDEDKPHFVYSERTVHAARLAEVFGADLDAIRRY